MLDFAKFAMRFAEIFVLFFFCAKLLEITVAGNCFALPFTAMDVGK